MSLKLSLLLFALFVLAISVFSMDPSPPVQLSSEIIPPSPASEKPVTSSVPVNNVVRNNRRRQDGKYPKKFKVKNPQTATGQSTTFNPYSASRPTFGPEPQTRTHS
ncbi:hypothetical protein HMI54_014053 [Coelomomyces lativittatus]|nr:hypothetical protein HMI56_006071 [Coelomomyces lativittatus]KAJ1496908.1 hypothetical protein HMI54_014053 [Coelomomyces lativittatus]KAJ1515945.1 hypothetical protein HMI55_003206 [Coelomomyces lativittatus]